MDSVRYLVFSGGGSKGMAFCGTMLVLHEMQRAGVFDASRLKGAIGCSIGSMFALACVMGLPPKPVLESVFGEHLLDDMEPDMDLSSLYHTNALDTGDVLFIVLTVLHLNALVFYTLIPLTIARGCKGIQKALTARAFEGLARAPEAALRFTLLRDTLESSGHFGLRVCGLHLTPRVIGRVVGLFITLSALLPRLPQAS